MKAVGGCSERSENGVTDVFRTAVRIRTNRGFVNYDEAFLDIPVEEKREALCYRELFLCCPDHRLLEIS